MDLGSYLKKERENLKLSQVDIANKINVTEDQICRIETGFTKKPRKYTLKALAYALNVDYNYLLQLAGYPPEQEEINLIPDYTQNKGSLIKHQLKEIVEIGLKETTKTLQEFGIALKHLNERFDKYGILPEESIPPGGIGMIPSQSKLPLVTGVKCGNFICPAEETYEMISVPESWGEVADFVIQVSGNSMEQYYIADGFYVAIKVYFRSSLDCHNAEFRLTS